MRERLPLPKKIANAPVLMVGLEMYFQAFMDLSPSRPSSMGGLRAIPWATIQQYAELLGIGSDLTELMHLHVHRMDEAFIKHLDGKSSDGRPGGLRSKNKTPRPAGGGGG